MPNFAPAPEDERSSKERKSAQTFVRRWLEELDKALKREKTFRLEGRKLAEKYEGEEKETCPYNILYSNTDTLLPALYNAPPRPLVSSRFQRKDDALQRLAAMTSERILKYLINTNDGEYEPFDDGMQQTVLESLVPGRGNMRVKYDARFGKAEEGASEAQGEEEPTPDTEVTETEKGSEISAPETVSYEAVCVESVPWDFFLHGYGRKWEQVPWVSYEHHMTREELEDNFGAVAMHCKTADFSDSADSKPEASDSLFGNRTRESKGASLAIVYEIWDKKTRKVFFISPNCPDFVLKSVEDPLGLSGFFPGPAPLSFMNKVQGLTPVALYRMYSQQADELNTITVRITKLVKALRVRGFYDNTVEGLEKVLKADDNELVPIANAAAIVSQHQKLDDAIWIMPFNEIVAALQQLYLQRNTIKGVIFEITGIADIMRGSSQASETLGAQEIKSQWGTLRLKKSQKRVTKYSCSVLRLMLEVAVNKLAEETIRAMTGLPFPTAEEKTQAQAQLQQWQAQAMAQSQAAAAMGQQLPPPQPDPQLLALTQSPSWADILGLLRNDALRQFSVDIETNSTVDAEATDDKKDMAELMNALAQFLNGVEPLVSSGALPFEASKVILQNLLRRFRMGGEVEDALMQMQQPQGGGGNPEAQKQLQAAQQKLAQEQQKFQEDVATQKQKQSEAEAGLRLQQRELELAKEFAKKELDLQAQFNAKALEMQAKAAEQNLAMKAQADQQAMAMQSQKDQFQAQVREAVFNAKAQAAAAKAKTQSKGGSNADI